MTYAMSAFHPLRTLAKRAFLWSGMTDTPVAPFYAPPRSEAALIAVVGLAGYLLVAPILGEGRGTVAGGFVVCFGLAVRICWPLRKQLWF